MNNTEKKYQLAKNIDPSLFKQNSILKIEIAGVKLVLNYKGREESIVKSFITSYLKVFISDFIKADIEVYYNVPEGELGDSNWECWNNWSQELELINAEDQIDILIERDFVAKISTDKTKIYAHGPVWSLATCDSIDNLLVYAIGLHSIKYNSVFLHAACVADDNFAYVFFGASGAGKSTLAEFLYHNENLKVLSSDQIILRVKGDEIFAQISPTTIPEFPLNHPAREMQIRKVRSICHLIQQKSAYSMRKLDDVEWLQLFMRELIFRKEFLNSNKLLDLSIEFSKIPLVYRGEMSYPKGERFWKQFLREII